MLDISLGEIALVCIVAALCIGPKDLPVVLRTLGRWSGALKKTAREFTQVWEEALREAEADSAAAPTAKITYIRDLEGNLQETYDISDLKAPEPKKSTAQTDSEPTPESRPAAG